MRKILFAASEGVPFIKTGGLADVIGSLPKCFNQKYFDVRVIMPKYSCISQEYRDQMTYVDHFYMDIGRKTQYVGVFELVYEGVPFYFVDNEYFFSGDKPYGGLLWDLEKFAFFSKAALSVLPVVDFKPDINSCFFKRTLP